jgi:hypothetical protein
MSRRFTKILANCGRIAFGMLLAIKGVATITIALLHGQIAFLMFAASRADQPIGFIAIAAACTLIAVGGLWYAWIGIEGFRAREPDAGALPQT